MGNLKARVHILGLPHTRVSKAWSSCAFTQLLMGFCEVLRRLELEAVVYAPGSSGEAACAEHVEVLTEAERVELCGEHACDALRAPYDVSAPHWRLFCARAAEAVRRRARPGDVLAMSAGAMHQPVASACPELVQVEHAAGYVGASPRSRVVFPSYAWMNAVHARFLSPGWPAARLGDAVVPHFVDLADFEYREDKEGYLLLLGRVNRDKGWPWAVEAARAVGRRLVVAGQGDALPADVDQRGLVGPGERRELLAGASAVLALPTYAEPFGMTAIEAAASGTPVVATDVGGLTETVEEGVTGYRVRTFRGLVEALRKVDRVDPAACRRRVERLYTAGAVAPAYGAFLGEVVHDFMER